MLKNKLLILALVAALLIACEPVTEEELQSADEAGEEQNAEEVLKEIVNEISGEPEIKEEIKKGLDAGLNESEEVKQPPEEIEIKKIEEPKGQKNESVQQPAQRKPKTILIEKMELIPAELIIFPDTEVIWVNKDSIPHKITGPGFSSGVLNQNQEYRHRFMTAGKYNFIDEFHRSLWGQVIVFDPASISLDVREPEDVAWVIIENYGFNPRTVAIKQGQTIIWENRDPMAHTVKGPGFESKALMSKNKFYYTFSQIGTYNYQCTKHDGEQGQVVVS